MPPQPPPDDTEAGADGQPPLPAAGADGQPPLPAAGADGQPPAGIQALPAEVEAAIFASLPPSDLAACMATCRAWRAAAAAPALWQDLAARRWQHGDDCRKLAALRAAGRCDLVYARRRGRDARALALLRRLQWPDQEHDAMQALRELPFSAVRDALARLARGAADTGSRDDWRDVEAAACAAPCGAPYWAAAAHEELLVAHLAARLRRCAARAAAAQSILDGRHEEEGEAEGAAAQAGQLEGATHGGGDSNVAAAADDGALTPPSPERLRAWRRQLDQAEEQQAAPDERGEPAAQGAWAPALRGLRSAELRALLALSLEEGALALAEAHRPLADLGWVRDALDALGEELRRRMAAAGAPCGLPALQLLRGLLFGEGPPPRHRDFASIPPPDGYGLELTGNRERYYDPANSLLDSVLTQREGIPASLCLLAAAVGARAGLPVMLLGVPMHLLCAVDLAAGTPDHRGGGRMVWVDAFDGGRIMDAGECRAFLWELGLPAVEPMSPAQLWERACRNLLQLHRQHGEHRRAKATALLMAAAAGEHSADALRMAVGECIALQQYGEAAALLRAQLAASPLQPPHPPVSAAALGSMAREMEAAAQAHTANQMTVRGAEVRGGVLFRVGDVIRHTRYHYRGVIIGWDPVCCASAEWQQQMRVARLQGGAAQPFYQVLPDPEERPGQGQTYVAQENVALEALPALLARDPGFALHPQAGRYFDSLAPDGARYFPNAWLRHCYPEG